MRKRKRWKNGGRMRNMDWKKDRVRGDKFSGVNFINMLTSFMCANTYFYFNVNITKKWFKYSNVLDSK